MKTRILFGLALVVSLLATLSGPTPTRALEIPIADPNEPSADVAHTPAQPQDQAIIIDHTTTDITQIPDYWIEQAKKVAVHYAHTSHGSQVLSGLDWLEGQNSKYNVAILASGAVALPSDTTAMRFYDGNNYPGDTYITPEQYWQATNGVSHTQSVANTGWFTYSTWTWCGQQSSNTTPTVQLYLDTLHGLEQQYPNMRFIYMTGHTDGGSSTLARNNEMVRQYVRDNNKVLFDFADIETYDPLGGGPYVNNSEGTCTWCASFCTAHPEYCTSLPSSCAHTSSPSQARLFCRLKGQAWWWLMARLAGWPGPQGDSLSISKSVALTHNPAWPGDPITYTVVVRNTGDADAASVRITDTLPTYVEGTDLDATRTVTAGQAVTLTLYAHVAASAPSGATITNTAYYSHTTRGSASASFNVITLAPDLSTSTKTVKPSTVLAGDLVTFTLTFTNSGTANATVRYTDTLPAQVDWHSGPLSGIASVNTGSAALPTTIVARAKRDLANGTTFSNTVAINDNVHAVFNKSSSAVTVLAPDLSNSGRTNNKSVFAPGERITYTLTLINSGGVDTTARYTITLPTEVSLVSGNLNGSAMVGISTAAVPAVVVGQISSGVLTGTTFYARVDINDGYHSVYTLNFPMTAIGAFYTHLPLIMRNYSPTQPVSPTQAIIIDHTTTNASLIPSQWITQAKSLLRLSYGHTSHGSQLVSGMSTLRTGNILYNYNTNGSTQSGVLSLADYTPSGDLGNPDRTTWATRTRTYLSGTGSNRNVVMWSWCGQAGTATATDIDTYLNLMSQLERDYPNVKFVYMTGHLDGGGPNGNLYQRNNQIRAYVRANNKILFDFADIESYDPAGTYYPNASDSCSWCSTWCSAHPADCAQLPSSCAHSHSFNCLRKGNAAWWLFARLAGWNGVTQ